MTNPFGGGPFQVGPPGQGGAPPLDWRPLAIWGGALAVAIALFAVAVWLLQVYTDLLWFGNLGFADVFRTILVTRVWLFFAGALAFAALAGVNVALTYRYGSGPQVIPIPEETLRIARPLAVVGAVFVVFVTSLIFGGTLGGRWETVLAFQNAAAFGQADPQFGKDISFYVFNLPLYHLVQGWLLGALIVTILLTVGMYFVHFSLRGAVFAFTPPVRIQVSVLGALLLFVFTYGYWLEIFDLVYSAQGAVVGATYADVHARLPALRILMAVVSAGGLLLLVNAFWVRGVRLLVGVVFLWIGASIVVGTVYPGLVQRFQVVPAELARERPYIARNIAGTRAAFDLDRIEERPYTIKETPVVTAGMVAANQGIVENVRLWDHRPFRDIINQIQFFRIYYDFLNVDVDRYTIEGRYLQTMLSARELSPEKLPSEAQRWVNRKLQFTHGYGAAMAPVTGYTPDGRPRFVVQDLPPEGKVPLERPEIYYGEGTREYVIANSRVAEFSYPTATDTPVYAHYQGRGGVPLSSLVRRLAYAWQFKDVNILISGEVSPESRIQYRRAIQERVGTVAPFLALDPDPYLVIADGRLFWVQDAYTLTDRYPYSTPLGGRMGPFNYIRNSVKVVMDAYHGEMTFYVSDETDPLVATYASIFPTLFRPLSEMPEYLRSHIRYPEGLFRAQAQQYLQYHMTDTTVFFNKEDQWGIPNEFFFGAPQAMEPYYLIIKLPGETREEFVQIMPFTPANRPNMVAWLAARSDGEHYGQLVNFTFPRGQQLDGPQQVEARIDNDPVISQQFTLWGQVGSEVLRGNLLVVPLDGAIMYVEPVFLQAANLKFPELKQVIVADSRSVVMRPTLPAALAALTSGAPPLVSPVPLPGDGGGGGTTPPGEGELPTLQESLEELSGAVGRIQEEMARLQEALERLRKLAEGGAP